MFSSTFWWCCDGYCRLEKLNSTENKTDEVYDEMIKVGKALEQLEDEIAGEKRILEESASFKYVSLNIKNKEANFQKDLVVSILVYNCLAV
jgi:sulfur transfer protein SufE